MSCREPQRADDRVVKGLLQRCLPGVEVCLHDDGTQDQMYDLDLRWPDGHVAALEVTTHTSEQMLRLGHRIGQQGHVVATEAARDWFLWLAVGTDDVQRVRAKADHLLALVERAGVTRLGEREARSSVAVARVRRQLGVNYGFSREAKDRPRIVVSLPMDWFFVQPEAVNEAVEDHARRNAVKLARSGLEERHLFVLMVPPLRAWTALVEREPPTAPPQLPEAVTTVWAASYRQGEPVVWRVRRSGCWEVLL